MGINEIDDRIDRIYRQRCSGVPIHFMRRRDDFDKKWHLSSPGQIGPRSSSYKRAPNQGDA